jgi:adenylate cyclase
MFAAKSICMNTQPSTAPAAIQDADLARLRHELRTPINHILGYCEMLLEESQLPPAALEDLRRIHAGGRELQVLIGRYFEAGAILQRLDLHQLYHELRTPVNHIIGYSDLLIEQAEEMGSTVTVPDLKKIREAASQWLALMEAYLVDPALNTLDGQTAKEGAPARLLDVGLTFRAPEPRTSGESFRDEGAILIVDDDETSREMLARRLRPCGYAVTATSNGLQALALARGQKFDLVLLDMVMAGLDGFQVLARFKADPHLRDLPVIMLSALDDENGIARCLEMGAEDYLPKPFNPVVLRARVSAALEKKRLRDREVRYLLQIEREKQRADELLQIILPRDVAEELKATNTVQPRRFENVGVLFCDLVGFTAYCEQHPPEEIVAQLQQVIEVFERLALRHGLEKIKTVGDSFMCTAGLPAPLPNPALNCIRCATEMAAAARALPPRWEVRIGVNVGPVIAGVIGGRKYQYDVWGDTVNVAARMEAAAEPGSICVPAETWRVLEGACQARAIGPVAVKGKGRLEVYQMEAITPERAISAAARIG